MKAFVEVSEPRVRVAVRVTSAGSEPGPGRVTAPLALITAGASEAHETAEPKGPVAGRVRSSVTPERSPSERASVSEATRLASVSEIAATSAEVSARS